MQTALKRITSIKKIILWSVIIGALVSLFVPSLVYGQPKPINPCEISGNCLKGTEDLANGGVTGNTISSFLLQIAQFATFVAAAVAVLFIVLGGYQMITSNGDSTKYGNALKTVQYAVIGLVLAAVAYTIIAVVSGFITTIDISNPSS
jgi:hypothetical protein